jgi:hypothetical protein
MTYQSVASVTKKESFIALEFVVNALRHFSLSQKNRQNKLVCLPLVKLLQSNLIFVSKARAHPSEGASLFTLGKDSGLTQRYYNKLERPNMDEHTNL